MFFYHFLYLKSSFYFLFPKRWELKYKKKKGQNLVYKRKARGIWRYLPIRNKSNSVSVTWHPPEVKPKPTTAATKACKELLSTTKDQVRKETTTKKTRHTLSNISQCGPWCCGTWLGSWWGANKGSHVPFPSYSFFFFFFALTGKLHCYFLNVNLFLSPKFQKKVLSERGQISLKIMYLTDLLMVHSCDPKIYF